jgi:hypothetical protein
MRIFFGSGDGIDEYSGIIDDEFSYYERDRGIMGNLFNRSPISVDYYDTDDGDVQRTVSLNGKTFRSKTLTTEDLAVHQYGYFSDETDKPRYRSRMVGRDC